MDGQTNGKINMDEQKDDFEGRIVNPNLNHNICLFCPDDVTPQIIKPVD